MLLLPQGLKANQGFSYYGDHARTVMLYRLAFTASGGCLLFSALFLPDVQPFRVIKLAFRLMPLLLLGLVLTTAPHSPLLDTIHRPIGVALFILQLALSCWLAFFVCKDRLNQWLFVLLLLSGLASFLALIYVIHYLIEGQVIFQLAFGVLIIHSLRKLKNVG